MKLYHTSAGVFAEHDFRFYSLPSEWHELMSMSNLLGHLEHVVSLENGLEELDAAMLVTNAPRQ